jgi:signal transduction histidine kinase
MHKRRLFVIGFIYFCVLSVSSQTPMIDSLRKSSLLSEKDPPKKAMLFNTLAEQFLYINADSALFYSTRALQTVKPPHFIDEVLVAQIIQATAYKNKGFHMQATELLNSLSRQIKQTKSDHIKSWFLITLGENNRALKKFDDGIKSLNEARLICIRGNDRYGLAQCYNRLAAISFEQFKLDTAIFYARLSTVNSFPDTVSPLVASNYDILGSIERVRLNFPGAYKYFTIAEKISLQTHDITGLSNILKNTCIAYAIQNKTGLSIQYGLAAFNHALKNGLLVIVKDVSDYLSADYAALGKFDSAYYFKSYSQEATLKIFDEKNLAIISYLNTKFELEKNEHLIEEQTNELEVRRKTNLFFVFLSFFMIAFILTTLYLYLKLRRTNRNILKQKELIEQQNQEIEKSVENRDDAYLKLKEMTAYKEGLTSMLVHDLKNSLNQILMLNTSHDSAEKMDRISQSARSMLNIIYNVLDVSMYEEKKLKLDKSETSLSLVIENACRETEFLAEQKNIKLEIERQNDFIVYVDSEIFKRVFINLLTNAIKFSPSNEHVKIRIIEMSRKRVRIEVSDQGEGIPKEEQDKVFRKFSQVRQKMSGFTRSSGLGLVFAKIAVSEHGGKIGFDSEVSKGALFWIFLPYIRRGDIQSDTGLLVFGGKNIDAPELSDSDRKRIERSIGSLRSLNYYEISEIKHLLKEIEEKKISGLENWLAELDRAVSLCNEQEYLRLLKMMIDEKAKNSSG